MHPLQWYQNFGSLQVHAIIYETARFFWGRKKVHFGLTFGACTIASVSYIGACTTICGNTVFLSGFSNQELPSFLIENDNTKCLCTPRYTLRKSYVQQKSGFRNIRLQSWDFFRKRPKWCPKKHIISRTVYATENLIWYSESTINFLSCLSHKIFAYIFRHCDKLSRKRPIFMHLSGFWAFSDFGETLSVVIQNGHKEDAKNQRPKFWPLQRGGGQSVGRGYPWQLVRGGGVLEIMRLQLV